MRPSSAWMLLRMQELRSIKSYFPMEVDKIGMGRHLEAATQRFLVLFFPRLLATALASQGFLHSLFLAGLQVKGVALYLLDDVFLLHLALEPAQRILEGFSLLDSYFRQTNYTPKLVPFGPNSYCKVPLASQELCMFDSRKSHLVLPDG